ncbi:MAG: HlyD family efflux transporter periplasmic adaptor subunit [Candidatus Levybacteria bacterium]|nr:HlyD family efflux transporter periplasmic adaptor subunit [Candidatus Levybacteria bacterium]
MNLFKRIISPLLKLSFRQKTIIIVIATVILFIAYKQISARFGPNKYMTEPAKKATIVEVVSETGEISATGRVDVYSPTNGVVENVMVKNAQNISEGQDLFTVKSSATEQEQKAAYSNYLTTQTTLNTANSQAFILRSEMFTKWKAYYDLSTNSTYQNPDGAPKEKEREAAEFQIARDNWFAAEKKYKDQQTQVSQAQAQSGSAWLLYQATQNAQIKAPSSGSIANLAITSGSSVEIKSPTGLTTVLPALTIASLKIPEAVVSLNETDITKVKEGQEAEIDVNATEKIYKGIARRVDSIGTDDQGVIRYNVYIEILKPDEKLRSGMAADISIITNKVSNALSVPNSAVRPYQGGRAVRIPDRKGEIKYIPIVTGIKGEQKTQILKGISEGQNVITALSNEQLKRPGLFGN